MAKAMSLNPETFTEGGGLIDDVDVVIKEARFVMWDYNGKSAAGDSPCLHLNLDLDGDEVEQYYSMGAAKDWMPSEDGKNLLAVGSASGIRKSSNGGIFLMSLIDAGFPADDLAEDVSVLDGLQAHMVQVPAPKRKGLKDEKESKYEKTILVVSSIIALPGEKKKPKGAPKNAGSGSTKPKGKATAKTEEPDNDINSAAVTAILGILADEPTLTKKDIPAKLFSVLGKDPNRNAIIKLAFDDEFLSSGPWTYADDTLIAN